MRCEAAAVIKWIRLTQVVNHDLGWSRPFSYVSPVTTYFDAFRVVPGPKDLARAIRVVDPAKRWWPGFNQYPAVPKTGYPWWVTDAFLSRDCLVDGCPQFTENNHLAVTDENGIAII